MAKGNVRVYLRLLAAAGIMVFYMAKLLVLYPLTGKNPATGLRIRKQFTGLLMHILGIRVKLEGKIPRGTFLFVSNHRSLIDPVVELHYLDAVVLSKAEVEKYPLIGRGAAITGVIFVHRDSKESRLAARKAIRDTIAKGRSVLIYPEGTTSALPGTRAFHPGSFHIAEESGIPIVPVVIEYGRESDYWEDTPLFSHFLRKFSNRRTRISLWFGEPLEPGPADLMAIETFGRINARIRQHQASPDFQTLT